MSRVKNPHNMEGVIHRGFHYLAMKHKVDVDKISDIVTDWDEWIEKNLKQRPVRKVRSKTGFFNKIIEVLVPVRFYWAEGEYDGLEFGPFKDGLTSHQSRLINEVLDAVAGRMIEKEDDVGIPRGILKEFEKGEEGKGGNE